jgi:hypothetical protein
MNRPRYLWNRRWTRFQVAIWLSALLVVIAVGILVATKVIGSWALLISSGVVAIVGLLGYWDETERVNRNGED